MEFKSLLAQTLSKQNKITQPTDALVKDGYLIVNNKVSKKYGIWFSMFVSAILTKYQSLALNDKFNNSTDKEFWYTTLDCFEEHSISYYHQRKARELGVELGLWKFEAKFNRNFPKSIINKTSHYTIDWDNVIQFFDAVANETIDCAASMKNQDALEQEAQEDEIKYQDKQANKDITIVDEQTIIEYAKIMSSQQGVPNAESYKLKIIRNALNGHKITLKNMELWLKTKEIGSDINKYDPQFKHLKYKSFYFENTKYQVLGINKANERYLVYGISDNHHKEVVFIKFDFFDEFVQGLVD
ncbi:MAG: hypothetical protein DRG78_06275 [Epsilonproteobacteria bacterium]|nr:MAG: hypothetical protein DRG78_06275 [Campylobacterota bacterium]